MRLEVGGLIGNGSVGGGVGFVEPIAGEFFDHVEEIDCLSLRHVSAAGSLDEFFSVAFDDIELFFADRLDAAKGTGEFDATNLVENSGDLFLVDHDSVGFGEQSVDDRVHFRHGFAAVLDIDIGHDHAAFERTGSIECAGGDDVVEAVGFHLGQQVAHPGAFELKDALGFASLQQREGFGIVERQFDRVDFDAL